MPSLFSRSRTTSNAKKTSTFLSTSEHANSFLPDEFGRVSSRASTHDVVNTSPHSLLKKDKKKASKDRSQTPSNPNKSYPADPARSTTPTPTPQYVEGAFLPLCLEPPRNRETGENRPKLLDYGFLSYERHVILAPEQVSRLVNVVTQELSTRGGITAPFIFSTTALDVLYSSVKRLIRAFLDTCDMRSSPSVAKAESKWREEARFAGMYELGMCLRWGLARVVRISKGHEVRGLIPWDIYLKFRESEAANRYPPGHFQTFLDDLSPTIQSITKTVLTLLIRLTANSTSSGHTPPTLSPLFGPLFFGLGHASLAFHHVYLHYLRATNAMEHIMLTFIRWQDTPRTGPSGSAAAALGVPVRLKDWIKGYPTSLPFLNDPRKDTTPQPRKGARTIRVLNVRRNVRLYSVDLVKSAAVWGSRAAPRPSVGPSNALYSSKEWERVAPSKLKLPPKYSEAFKKRMNMPPNFHPECGFGYEMLSVTSVSSASSSYMSSISSASSAASGSLEKDLYGNLNLGFHDGEDRFKSLTDMKWGEFESMGFGGIGESDQKLEFDLTESARQERSMKRQTLSWNDFSAAGFSRMDAPLSSTLQFSSPILNTVASWPSQKVEISKKLKKAEKSLPHFGWDTEPVVFNEEVVEEAFLDVFCDLIYGGGWMDGERYDEVNRDSNWALVEFKSIPPGTTVTSRIGDPRTAVMTVLFEEFVPIEYRQMLSQSSTTKRRLPSLFTPKSKQWKPAATLNGRPYEVGHVPRSPSYREVEFEGLLQAENSTKVISATSKPRGISMISTATSPPTTPQSAHFNVPPVPPFPAKFATEAIPPVPPMPARLAKVNEPMPRLFPTISTDSTFDSPASAKRMSRFRLPATMPMPNPSSRKKSGIPPAQYSIVEFETRLASYSDDEYKDANETESVKQRRRQSKDDAWVDILVGDRPRMLGDQDSNRKGLRSAHSDPDIASMEVAQVLAAVKNRSPSPPSMMERVDRDYGLDQHVQGLEIGEIETVPRMSDISHISYSDHRESGDVEDEDEELPDEPPEVTEESCGELKEEVTKAKMKARQGRPGYFDIHPERRHQLQATDVEDDIRAKLARDDSDEEAEAEIMSHSTTTAARLASMPIPQISLTPAPPVQTSNDHSIPKPVQSKTAALIEIYRERERGAFSQAPPPAVPKPMVPQVVNIPPAPVDAPASRIPVRPLPNPTVPTPPTPAEAAPDPSTDGSAPEGISWSDPPRYEHGTPLHNVIEEDEEHEYN